MHHVLQSSLQLCKPYRYHPASSLHAPHISRHDHPLKYAVPEPTIAPPPPGGGGGGTVLPVQGMHMKVLVRHIGTGCIFCAPSGLRQGQVFDPPAAPPPPPSKWESSAPPPPGTIRRVSGRRAWTSTRRPQGAKRCAKLVPSRKAFKVTRLWCKRF